MADFRRWFTVLAVLAVVAMTASAQVGVAVPGGSASSLLACNATAAGTPELRPEGYTELAGDIVIVCTGGQTLAAGSAIPTTNIVVYMAPAVPITSRFMSNSGAQGPGTPSEALLIIDEAGNTAIATGAPGFGPQAGQSLCTSAQQQTTPSPCSAIVGNSSGYEVAVTTAAGGTTPAPNVFQGKVGDFGANTVAFYNVPVLPPATTGVTRTFRITNVRVPVTGQSLTGTLQAIVSTSPSQVLPVTGTAINIGVVGPATSMAVKGGGGNPFQQCKQTVGTGNNPPANPTLTSTLIFTEGFATAFKTRVVPGGAQNLFGGGNPNTAWAAEATNTAPPSNQNIPGGLYGGFAANSESGFIYPGLTNSTGGNTYTAGLADFGTRLKAVFYNIPAGLTLYVSTTSTGTAPTIVGGTSLSPYAVLVATNSGEATPDGTTFGSNGTPIVTTTTNITDALNVIALTADSTGKAVAVWEVTNANPSAQDVLQFGVYIAFKTVAATSTLPFGSPITGLPLGSPVNDVQLSLAPEPGGGTFAAASLQGSSLPIPRFAIVKTQEGQFTAINLCQTTLLYPFVTGAAGFDTGVAVANTSMDPFKTPNQTGSCTLYGYGVTVAAAGNTAVQSVIPGCDSIANPLQGTNCFAVVPPGQVMSVMASSVLTNFQGYVIAVCNFQYAHGYAAVTDLGLRNLWSSYLALELSSGGVGTNRSNLPSGVEQLVH
jgi:hypothetical protein